MELVRSIQDRFSSFGNLGRQSGVSHRGIDLEGRALDAIGVEISLQLLGVALSQIGQLYNAALGRHGRIHNKHVFRIPVGVQGLKGRINEA